MTLHFLSRLRNTLSEDSEYHFSETIAKIRPKSALILARFL